MDACFYEKFCFYKANSAVIMLPYNNDSNKRSVLFSFASFGGLQFCKSNSYYVLPLYGAFLFAQNEAVQCLVGIYLSALIGLITPTLRYDRSPFLFGAFILEVMPYGFYTQTLLLEEIILRTNQLDLFIDTNTRTTVWCWFQRSVRQTR